MSYDIPPPLQHKEKIMFGLTFVQLAYAFPAFLLIFLLMFKSGLSLSITGTISILISAVAVFFMFFNGKNRILNFIKYLKNKDVSVNSISLRKLLTFKR